MAQDRLQEEHTPLDAEIRTRIARDGPMTIAEFMALCLYDPGHGYYNRRLPFGATGDFITAPEISQMFGEMVAVWVVEAWLAMGAPNPVVMIECGPGRGTMMADILRATRLHAAFRKALHVHLVETSPGLRKRQRETLSGVDLALNWHAGIDEVPAVPSILVANEFFDALPVRQAERRPDGWHERMVTVDAHGALTLAVAAEALSDSELPLARGMTAPVGGIFEWRSLDAATAIARRAAAGGAALIVDYGHMKSSTGDTFQAVRSHRYADPLVSPGLADLTAHVDFEVLGSAAQEAGARVHGPVEQGIWLKRMGIDVRAAMLQANASETKSIDFAGDVHRLTGTGPGQMGALFKVVAFSAPDIQQLPGFEP